MYTANCVVCVKEGKQVPATCWTGYVLKGDYVDVLAGYCSERHTNLLPHLEHISRRTYCVGEWVPEHGLIQRPSRYFRRSSKGSD